MLNGGTLLPMGAGKDLLIKQDIRSNFSFMINTYLRALPSLLYPPLGPGILFLEGGHSPYMLYPACGPVRVGEEPQAASVLLNPAVPVIERCERADAELGMPLRICVSTDGTRPGSVAEVEASTDGPDPTGGPVLAQPAVVPPTDVDADRSAAGNLPEGRSPDERGHCDAVPQTGGDEVNCMASVRKFFSDLVFSANVADTAARARRESTRRVYGSRLRHYQRWCMERGVDPVKAPLTEVAEFLENLRTIRHKGNPLAPSTFAGYRSAIAAIH